MKDHWFWRVRDNTVMPGYPMLINVFWRGLPPKIDAVYENSKGKFVFFKGRILTHQISVPQRSLFTSVRGDLSSEIGSAAISLALFGPGVWHRETPDPAERAMRTTQFWVFKDTMLQPGYPQDISMFGNGMPAQSIETAVWWEDVAKTYFFKGDRYWRYNEDLKMIDPGYPKSITVWKGVPDSPQGAFVDKANGGLGVGTSCMSSVRSCRRAGRQPRTSHLYPAPLPGLPVDAGAHLSVKGGLIFQGNCLANHTLKVIVGFLSAPSLHVNQKASVGETELRKLTLIMLRVEPGYPRSILKDFMGCDLTPIDPDTQPTEDEDVVIKLDNEASTVKAIAIVIPCILALCLLVLIYTVFQFKRKGTPRHILYCKRSMQEWVRRGAHFPPKLPSLVPLAPGAPAVGLAGGLRDRKDPTAHCAIPVPLFDVEIALGFTSAR
ncbi:Matrix metalloproteinase-16 [Labeo rohita]|uniref:Matrix metalloproteinase-16 n=1 Tax=Labeo rohita TaxID=84645 RepID=A0ABQ8LGT8_LABRO|nr:Matrix metalloproteinase-16 [Labeo rohita]